MTEPNADLFVKVLAQIEKHPESWDQSQWAQRTECGTTYCFAGHAALLSGLEADWTVALNTWDGRQYTGSVVSPFYLPIQDEAQRLLGLTTDEATRLFYTDGLDDLYRISAELLGLDETVLREKVAAAVADGRLQS